MFRQTVMKLLRLITCPHSTGTVEFRYGFKLLRLAFPFQKLLRLALRFHFFSCRYRVNATLNVRISFRFQTLLAWCERGLNVLTGQVTILEGVITQGRSDSDNWVTEYTVEHSSDKENWLHIRKDNAQLVRSFIFRDVINPRIELE